MRKAILLFGMLIATVQGGGGGDDDLCCSDIQKSLDDLKSDVADLQGVIKDLRERLGKEYNWPPNVICPPGFTYLPLTGSCYQVVYESHDWTSAGKVCQDLARGSHLVAIGNEVENIAVNKFLASEISRTVGKTDCIPTDMQALGKLFWTSGQRKDKTDCKTPFVWKLPNGVQVPFVFTFWLAGEPSCGSNSEFCVDIWAIKNFRWNDVPCNLQICPLCEYTPK